MTYNANIRQRIEEWTERLFLASYETMNSEWKIFLNRLDGLPIVKALVQNARDIAKSPPDLAEQLIKAFTDRGFHGFEFSNEHQRAATLYVFITECLPAFHEDPKTAISFVGDVHGGEFEPSRNNFLNGYVLPLIHYISDHLEGESSTLFLLERYKRRTEWFFQNSLLSAYETANASYEKIFEDDLRLFLFDQGIDYPFSTLLSPKGRTDVVALLETSEPLVLEIKIWDSKKDYKKSRILKGFNQIVQYTNDYNKQVGYLTVFNCDDIELEIESEDSKLNFPTRICFNNKSYYIIVINLKNNKTASKMGTLSKEKITKAEFLKEFEGFVPED